MPRSTAKRASDSPRLGGRHPQRVTDPPPEGARHVRIDIRGKRDAGARGEDKWHVDRVIAEIAGRQLGVVARHQLMSAGVSAQAIERRLATGRLHPLFRGVYLAGHEVPPAGAREYAATLAAGDGAIVFGASAADMWKLIPHEGPVHVAARSHRRSRSGLIVHRVAIERAEVTRLRSVIPITTAARTLVDVAPITPTATLEHATADAIRRKLTSERALARLAARHDGRPGVPSLKAILGLGNGPAYTRSDAARDLLALIRKAALPGPGVNEPVAGAERDFVWREHALVLELDSRGFHTDVIARRTDPRRDTDLAAAGYRVIRITALDVRDRPEWVIARIAAALAAPTRR